MTDVIFENSAIHVRGIGAFPVRLTVIPPNENTSGLVLGSLDFHPSRLNKLALCHDLPTDFLDRLCSCSAKAVRSSEDKWDPIVGRNLVFRRLETKIRVRLLRYSEMLSRRATGLARAI